MKTIYRIFKKVGGGIAALALFSGCTLFGLDVQKDYNRTPHTLDPKMDKTVWQYLKERSYGNTAETRVFARMMDAIIYSEIDTLEYTKPNRTFILMYGASSGNPPTLSAPAFWTNFKVNNANATNWNQYPKEFVRNYLKYLIVEGEYNHYTIPALQTINANTLCPAGYFNTLPTGITLANFIPNTNPESIMTIKVLNSSPSNTSDYPIQLNDVLNVRTSSILATNGTVHVIGSFFSPALPL
ncbi:hypothetical protein Pedsa_2063 [Pseudopedobacter saltans DSM 12145]|uniref:FAS1 domain-containing protein n=1 Tax=Pseudopedobacter saltans (strain ATCC 51119 / DSM 12145 / JCM 21818 / CCUG 39354 / LMG 10337 / NBRC 100064 / NCIMB 13643) TaxID=762903 RepID=F0SAJ5_PSESL|nr:hypothetical protein [Pseudopedobacter saltans]ADY52615.1 hypothetical protein Pedsa_2063 [Pseudopedobacter saltans DSM 12145]